MRQRRSGRRRGAGPQGKGIFRRRTKNDRKRRIFSGGEKVFVYRISGRSTGKSIHREVTRQATRRNFCVTFQTVENPGMRDDFR